MSYRITFVSPREMPLEMKWPTGEWKWVDRDWTGIPMDRLGWLREHNGVKQELQWIPARSQESKS